MRTFIPLIVIGAVLIAGGALAYDAAMVAGHALHPWLWWVFP